MAKLSKKAQERLTQKITEEVFNLVKKHYSNIAVTTKPDKVEITGYGMPNPGRICETKVIIYIGSDYEKNKG